MKKKSNHKIYGDGKKRFKKRFCYGYGEVGHFIADCPKEKKKNKYNKDDDKKTKTRKEVKLILMKNGNQMMIVTQVMMKRKR
jgi:hypothetical protein